MIVIDGSLQVVPQAITCGTGQLRAQEKSEPAVVQSLMTVNGEVQVIFPLKHIDEVIKGLQDAKEKGAQEESGLYVPGSQSEVELEVQKKRAIDEIATSDE